MANPRLTKEQLYLAHKLLSEIRRHLGELSCDDSKLLFAYRRKVMKELIYDERGNPAHRRRLKKAKRVEQNNLCAICGDALPQKYLVIDRIEGWLGYTEQNTRLIHQKCDIEEQIKRGYR